MSVCYTHLSDPGLCDTELHRCCCHDERVGRLPLARVVAASSLHKCRSAIRFILVWGCDGHVREARDVLLI